MTRRASEIKPRVLLFFLLWLVLTRGSPGGWAIGLAVAAAAAGVSWRLTPHPVHLRPGVVMGMAPRFLLASVAGGWDVGWRALHPRRPLAPGWIAYRTSLPPGGPRVALAGELSLQPGTLVAGSRGDRLLIHVLNRNRPRLLARIAEEEARLGDALKPGETRG